MAAFVTQASNFRWGAANVFDGTGSTATTAKYSGTAYLFDNATITMESLFSAFETDRAYVAANALSTKSVSAGSIASAASDTDFTYGTGGEKYSFYFAIVNGDDIYFSNLKADITAPSTAAAANIAFGTQNNNTATFSSLAPASGFQGAGHWSSVPEPTSGLLLLLGMAGLALKRKRA